MAVKVTELPSEAGFGAANNVTAEAAFTVTFTAVEVLPVVEASPAYRAVITCRPATSDEVVNDAMPADNEPVPITVAPSRNSTTPIAVEGVAVAVKVTG